MIPSNFGWPIWRHTAPPEADLGLLHPHNTGIVPSHPTGGGAHGGRTEATMVPPCPMSDGFGTSWIWAGTGNAPVVALGLGTTLAHPQSGVGGFGCAKGTAGGTRCKMG